MVGNEISIEDVAVDCVLDEEPGERASLVQEAAELTRIFCAILRKTQ